MVGSLSAAEVIVDGVFDYEIKILSDAAGELFFSSG